ncbi:Phosphorus acquisition-controlling protein [Pseudocercospora fuligena]|uniref:Phosphorus acquisition-controlling protein n=1 Tax=Pseudocercospora fuligena TaxID=685502 RepID=A0A8H6VNC1_9PEZI|nr:Phosphorus acquisition-controlling protein [Pseudocercospora fuligena]
MDASTEQAWSRAPDQVDPMAQMNTTLDDLGNLFEFGDIDLNNIPSVDAPHYDEHMQQSGKHPHTPFDEISEAQAITGTSAQDFGAHQFGISTSDHGQQQHRFNGQGQTSNPYAQDAVFQQQMQGFHQNQQFQFQGMQGFPSHQHVPPTPNSFEMHGEAGRFLQHQMDPQHRAILEQRYQLRKEDAIAFTPMVSPAGTPQYNVQPEFTIPGAYFSPLTSPMLEAQNGQAQHNQGYYTNPSTAPSSNATSPLDPSIDVDMMGDELSLNDAVDPQSRKSTRRKIATPRSAGPLARVKQSPIQKASKRKSGTMLSSLAPTLELDGNLELQRSKSAQPVSGGLQMPRNDSSENGSISPEPLSEALMGPPPKPTSSKTHSPAITGQQKAQNALGKAATPKSLLSMRGASQASAKVDQRSAGATNDPMVLEDIQLPAAADSSSRRPSLSQINTQVPSSTSAETTPRLSARKTPKLGPQSTPSSARPASAASAAPSPSLVGSPMTASTPGALLKNGKVDSKGGRGNKKRGSVSSNGTLLSPALRPRISPSIKPLLPEGASLHSPTHALLLASKSNYQNLLEGNHLPGVNYPDSLSTGLTSKRTSHKVAEQGRRNRINEALKEMQSLLPKVAQSKTKDPASSDSPEAAADLDSKDAKEDSAAKSNNSKAATVESANEYIRKLQKENAALLALKQENDEMRKRLQQHESGGFNSPADSTSSAAVDAK